MHHARTDANIRLITIFLFSLSSPFVWLCLCASGRGADGVFSLAIDRSSTIARRRLRLAPALIAVGSDTPRDRAHVDAHTRGTRALSTALVLVSVMADLLAWGDWSLSSLSGAAGGLLQEQSAVEYAAFRDFTLAPTWAHLALYLMTCTAVTLAVSRARGTCGPRIASGR